MVSAEDKTKYVQEINDGMKWSLGDENYVSEGDIEDNPAQRSFYKVRT